MIRLLLISIFFLQIFLSHAQLYTDQPPSELILELRKNNPDSVRLLLLLQLTRKYYFEQGSSRKTLDSVLTLLQQAQQLSSEMHSVKFQPEIFTYMGKYYHMIGKPQEAEDYELKAIEFISDLGPVDKQLTRWKRLAWAIPVLDSIGLTRINCFEKMRLIYKGLNDLEKEIEMLREIADTRMKQGKLQMAENELSQVLDQYKAIGFKNLHYTYNLLAVTNRLKGNYDKALRYALLAVESIHKTNDTGAIITFYAHLAFLYHELGKTKESIEQHKRYFELDHHRGYNFYFFRQVSFFISDLLKDGQKEEAGKFLLEFPKKYPPLDPYGKAILAKTFADYHKALGEYSLADKYIRQMIHLERSLGKNNEVRRDIVYDIGLYYFAKKQFELAEVYFGKALDEAIWNNEASAIRNIHLMLFKTDSSVGKYLTAIKHLNRYRQLHDSIFAVAKIREAEEVQVKYETEKKVQNIKLLEQESKLHQERLSKVSITRNWILAGSALLLVVMGLLIRNAKLKQRTNRRLRQQRMEIEQQNLSLRHLVNEKGWLLKEIHHRVKNNLQIVMSLLNSQSDYIDNKSALTAIQDSQHRVQAMSLIHQKLYNSENLSTIDMSFYIRELTSYLCDSYNIGQRIHFEFDIPMLEMDVSQAVPLGLILNEAITNSIKYAFPEGRSGVISISLSNTSLNHYLLAISDNGVGMPLHLADKDHDSLGMSLMKGLSEDLNGHLSIENRNGTTIRVSFVHDFIVKRVEPVVSLETR